MFPCMGDCVASQISRSSVCLVIYVTLLHGDILIQLSSVPLFSDEREIAAFYIQRRSAKDVL